MIDKVGEGLYRIVAGKHIIYTNELGVAEFERAWREYLKQYAV